MRVWRITKAKYAATAFDGEGAKRDGGRWNHPGVAVVYTSDSAALATLELLVRLQDVRLLTNYVLMPAEVPEEWVEDLDVTTLGQGWRSHPHTNMTRNAGQLWLAAGASLALRVPSVVVPGFNVLLNPGHPRWVKVKLGEPLLDAFDGRLLG